MGQMIVSQMMKWVGVIFISLIITGGLYSDLKAADPLPLPDTGQTKFYDNKREICCPSPERVFYGQDAHYTRNRSFTKLDSAGNDLSDSAMGWFMVRDNVTGLIWEIKRNRDLVENYDDLHDADNRYTWYDSNPATNGGNPGTAGDGTDTEDFIAAMNAGTGYCGRTDWRLPTVNELFRLTDLNHSYPAIDDTFFCQCLLLGCWSSTTLFSNDGYAGYAWYVDFNSGSVDNESKSCDYYNVRAVCSAQQRSQDSLVDNGDGTVTDPNTGLMWQQAEVGAMNWQTALAYCDDLVLPVGGYDDWRLPDRYELQSLVDYNLNNPCLDRAFFPGVLSSAYWSSTTYDSFSSHAWCINFRNGDANSGYKLDDSYSLRAVRSGNTRPVTGLISYVSGAEGCGGNPSCYDTIGDAYQNTDDFREIRVTEGFYPESLLFERSIEVFLSGGWSSDYATNNDAYSSICGTLIISDGTVIVENIVITGVAALAKKEQLICCQRGMYVD